MSKMFRPMLFPNKKTDLKTVNGTYLCSSKLDGIRCLFIDGEMYSRNMKPIRNVKLHEKFKRLKTFSKENGMILDGELYCPKMSFQDITSQVMSLDVEVDEHLRFYCFDFLYPEKPNMTAEERYLAYKEISTAFCEVMFPVEQHKYTLPGDLDAVERLYRDNLKNGLEGLILKRADSIYKNGRVTIKSGAGYKYKPIETWDAQITGVKQATEVDPEAEKTVNELGYSKTSRKKDDRVLIDKAGAFMVSWEGKDLLVSLKMTDAEKEEVWANRDKYIGKWIEFEGMTVGAKNVPRFPVFKRFREDKE